MSSKITDLDALTAPVGTDLLETVDVSDTSMAGTGTNKQMTVDTLSSVILSPPPQLSTVNYGYPDGAAFIGQAVFTMVANTLYYEAPLWLPWSLRITAAQIEVTTGVGSSSVRLGIAEMDTTDYQPSDLLGDFGTVATTAVGTQAITGLTIDIPAFTLWSPILISNAASLLRFVGVAALNPTWRILTGQSIVPLDHFTIASQSAQHTALSDPPPDWTTEAGATNTTTARMMQFQWTAIP